MTTWTYHLPDVLLAALSYLVVARLVLLPLAAHNPVVRTLTALTAPIVVAMAAITPRLVPRAGLLFAALAWLYAARIILRVGIAATGVRLG